MTIDIVLATYNGAAYLAAQIDSILAQDFTDWRLIIRDDVSTDNTPAIVAAYAAKHPQRIMLLEGEKKRLGVIGNFSALLAVATAPYIMCADQDDVWQGNKVSLTLTGMRELEAEYGTEVPLLVHTDSVIVDAGLNTMAKSFAGFHKLKPHDSPLSRLLVQNTVQGCTVMVNRALLARALPIPPVVRMYDMWLALVAAGLGHIGYIEQATLRYRQHSRNAVGARKKTLRERVGHIQNMIESNVTQAVMYLDRFTADLSPEDRTTVTALAKLPDSGFFKRRALLSQHKLLRQPGWQNWPVMLFV